MEHNLTESEIISLISPEPVRVFRFKNLEDAKISDIINKNNPNAVIHYQIGEDENHINGHWCAMKYLDKHNIAYFDSYGSNVDAILKKIPKEYKAMSGQNKPFLIEAMIRDPELKNNDYIWFNSSRLQKSDPEINTCGRWVGFFLKMDMNPDDFARFIKRIAKYNKLSTDELIVILTS